jgi:glycosyltransferase involved in cell wall biosynthesis
MPKVLVVGQTPPPHHGQAVMIERLLNSQMADVEMVHVRMNFSSEMRDVGRFRWGKIAHLAGVIARIVYHRFADGARTLYFPPAGPDRVPMYRDMAILLSTRWLFDQTIFHFHAGGVSEMYDRLPAWQRWLFRKAYFGADAAIRLSELNPEDGRKLNATREFVIPNGIDDPCPDGAVARTTSAAAAGEPLQILFVGALRESKGVLDLVEACGKLAARGMPFQLELVGQWQSDEFAARVTQRIGELNIEERVRFAGVLTGEEKFAAFRRADVFCFPTFFECETFGLVLVEAMASRLPVVSTRWRAIPSIVDEGETGLLVEPHDTDALADRLAQLAADPAARQRLGSAGRAKFEREYTFKRHISRMRKMLLETAGQAVVPERERLSEAVAGS